MLSAVILIAVLEHYFSARFTSFQEVELIQYIVVVIAALFVAAGYSYFAAFYRASALEVKRLGITQSPFPVSRSFFR
jgi:hypothetical protein